MKQLTLWLLIGILTLAGCEGGTQTNVQSRCGGADGPNVCMVTLVSIEGGVYRHDIKNSSFWQGTTAIEVTVRITVEKGTLRVWLEDPQRNKTLVGVEPGQAAELKGVASVTDTGGTRSFSVYFEPLGEAKRAENVQAEIRYDTHHTISKSPRNSTTQVSSAVGSSERVEHVKMGPRSLATGAVTKIGERRHDDGGGPSATAVRPRDSTRICRIAASCFEIGRSIRRSDTAGSQSSCGGTKDSTTAVLVLDTDWRDNPL